MNRRHFVRTLGALAGTAAAAPLLASSSDSAARPRALRIAHLTDTHVSDHKNCPGGLERMFAALAALDPAPDLVMHTGDVIMDSWAVHDAARVEKLWSVWRAAAARLPAPLRACLGNHDIWIGETRTHEKFRYQLRAMDELQLERPWYAFEQGGWRFLMLESTRPIVDGSKSYYAARLDQEQLEWFLGELARTPATQPLVVCSHIPILSAAVHDWAQYRETVPDFPSAGKTGSAWMFGAPLMHSDTHQLQAALRKRGGVTLCLSGHLHLHDHVVYDGVHYLGNGAVSANWWTTPFFHQTSAGFAVLDLHSDGTWSREYRSCAWS